ncbi:thiol reductase thioredoxin [Bacillus atrophaeus]|uniref:thioredoxin family protein n=1 Tax=Bacillus atrophaeus TaxID=1452 RepID=UPI000D02C8EB|nr:thioredoxin family protein [Bacillus atrophaeus]PRS09689.1 thiol reductase thioredoxin [Bacillus atrophaeus]QUF67212.1 thioredoxin family protein [Bacillus atrophaeus]
MVETVELTSLDSIDNFIHHNKFSFLYNSRPDCGVCHAVLPQLRDLLDKFPHIKLGYINAYNVEEIASRFSILTVPALLLFIEGTEYLREARFVHFEQLEKRLERVSKIYTT